MVPGRFIPLGLAALCGTSILASGELHPIVALEEAVAKIKEKPTQLVLRARSTSDRVSELRESWWPIYK